MNTNRIYVVCQIALLSAVVMIALALGLAIAPVTFAYMIVLGIVMDSYLAANLVIVHFNRNQQKAVEERFSLI